MQPQWLVLKDGVQAGAGSTVQVFSIKITTGILDLIRLIAHLCHYNLAPVIAILTGIKLVWEQENPIQEKHRQVPRRGQHVRSEDCSQCNQRVCSWQPGKLPINSQFSR